MKKNSFKTKLGTILTAIACVIVATLIWLSFNIGESETAGLVLEALRFI